MYLYIEYYVGPIAWIVFIGRIRAEHGKGNQNQRAQYKVATLYMKEYTGGYSFKEQHFCHRS